MSRVIQDVTSVPLTCGSDDALRSFDRGVVAYVTMRENPLPWFREALEKDGTFIVARAMMVAS